MYAVRLGLAGVRSTLTNSRLASKLRRKRTRLSPWKIKSKWGGVLPAGCRRAPDSRRGGRGPAPAGRSRPSRLEPSQLVRGRAVADSPRRRAAAVRSGRPLSARGATSTVGGYRVASAEREAAAGHGQAEGVTGALGGRTGPGPGLPWAGRGRAFMGYRTPVSTPLLNV
jgi:hypothetical protein